MVLKRKKENLQGTPQGVENCSKETFKTLWQNLDKYLANRGNHGPVVSLDSDQQQPIVKFNYYDYFEKEIFCGILKYTLCNTV